jgi:hypothetical protein
MFLAAKHQWKNAIKINSFNKLLVTGLLLVAILFAVFPVFFQHIQKREGAPLNDVVLNSIAPLNVSVPLFIIIWGLGLFMGIKALQQPRMLLLFLWAFVFLSLFRITCIWLVNLAPPQGLIPLSDPISNSFYGKNFITKDLFFSGHTSTIFLVYLCLQNKADKMAALLCTILVAILVLVQHIHYTVDVLAAPLFAALSYYIGKKITTPVLAAPALKNE